MHEVNEYCQQYFQRLHQVIAALEVEKINRVVAVLREAYDHDRQVFLFGNGGSASTAAHFACDLGKGTVRRLDDAGERRFRVIALTDNVATLTAYANDRAFEDIFYQQLRNLVRPGDVVIGISASGNSANVVKAMRYAKTCGATTIGFLGFHTGGQLQAIVDHDLTVQDDHYGRVEDVHLILQHVITTYLRERLP